MRRAMAICAVIVLSGACSAGDETLLTSAPASSPAPPSAESGAEPTAPSSPRMRRCQEAPLPVIPREAREPVSLRLTWDAQDERFREDPAPLPDALVAEADGAVVQIQDAYGNAMGSGFIVEAAGRPVVVTAAHVTRDLPVADLRIADVAGTRVGVLDGCYAFQEGDTSIPVEVYAGEVHSLDISVLVPAGPVGTTALPIAPEAAAPGDWVFLDNFQGEFRASYGRDLYTAVVLYESWLSPYSALTGIGTLHQPDDRHPPSGPGVTDLRPENAMIGGASGGAVIDLDGRIVGMSIGSTLVDYLDPGQLSAMGVEISGIDVGYTTAIEPVAAIVIPPDDITAVLEIAIGALPSLQAVG